MEKDNDRATQSTKVCDIVPEKFSIGLTATDYSDGGMLEAKVATAFEDKEVKLVAGKVRNFSSTDEEIIQNQNLSAEGLMCWKPGVQFVQPGVWMRRELIEQCGGIDEQFHYAFDWDLYIRYLYYFPVVKEIPDLLVHFRLHSNSKTQSSIEKFAIEEHANNKKIKLVKVNLKNYITLAI